MIADYPTEDAALDVVRRTVAAHGRAQVATWALAFEDTRGRTKATAFGPDLADRALQARSA